MPGDTPTAGAANDPLIGTEINGTYRVLRQIGWGGMGTIYEVAHVHLPKRFALKVMLPEVAADEVSYERFRREAVTASSLGNPHIAEVVDFNLLPDGAPFMVMELLEGEDLVARLRARGRLEAAEAAQLIGDVGSALSAAHSKGILHRDIKPANIFLARIPGGGEVIKLLDFGTAKIARTNDLTARGQVVGTPWYMSPEQARGQDLDVRTDEFSLAVVMYEALAGRVPFDGDEPVKVLFKIADDPPPPLSELGIAAPIQAVIERALAKDREQRYPTIAEFADALTLALTGRRRAVPSTQVLSLPRAPPTQADLPPLPSRDPRPMWALGAGVVVAVSVGAFLLWGRTPQPVVLPPAVVVVPASAPARSTPAPAPTPPPVPAKPTSLAIDSDPPGAAIRVDGEDRGVAPVTLKGLALGPHTLLAHRGDRADVTRSVTFDTAGQSMEVLLRFGPAPPPPPSAAVVARHEPSERRAPAKTSPAPVPVAPAPAALAARQGKLSLDTVPWTTVSEGGVSLGETPLAAVPLAAGTHRLHLVNADHHVDQIVEVIVTAGKTTVTKLHF